MASIVSKRYQVSFFALATYNAVKGQLEAFKLRFKNICKRYDIVSVLFDPKNVNTTGQRSKRFTLFPFGAKVLGFLFGTASKSDISGMKQDINSIKANEIKIFHYLEQALIYMNVTKSEVQQNRESINQLIDSATFLATELNYTIHELNQLEHYMSTLAHYSLVFGRIRDLIESGNNYLITLEMLLGQLSSGDLSPSLIPPDQFTELLQKLQSELPANLKIPFDPVRELLKYYTLQKASVLAHDNQIIVFTTIPLKDQMSEFSILHVLNTPIPSPVKNSNLTATYNIETENIAFNPDRSHYALLTQEEVLTCQKDNFCSVSSPLYSTSLNNRCVIALYFGIRQEIDRICTTKVKTTQLPSAQNLGTGDWLVVTDSLLDFTVVCNNGKTSRQQIDYPMGLVELDISCTASHPHLTLTSHHVGQTEIPYRDMFKYLLEVARDNVTQVWDTFNRTFHGKSVTIPPHLGNIVDMTMDNLINSIQKAEFFGNLEIDYSSQLSIVYGVITLNMVLVIGAIGLGTWVACRGGSRGMHTRSVTVEYSNRAIPLAPPLERSSNLYPALTGSTVNLVETAPEPRNPAQASPRQVKLLSFAQPTF